MIHNAMNAKSKKLLNYALDPLEFSNTDAYLSRQAPIDVSPMTEDDLILVNILNIQMRRVKVQMFKFFPVYRPILDDQLIQNYHFYDEDLAYPTFSAEILKETAQKDTRSDWMPEISGEEPYFSYDQEGVWPKHSYEVWDDSPISSTPLQDFEQLSNDSDDSLSNNFDEYSYNPFYHEIKGEWDSLQNEELDNMSDLHSDFLHSRQIQDACQIKDSHIINSSIISSPHSKLALRSDVMNKNIIRAIRRECKNLFDLYAKSCSVSCIKNSDEFNTVNLSFAEHILNKMDTDWRKWTHFNFEDFAIYLGAFSNYWAMKRLTLGGCHKLKVDKVYGVFYKYSHQRFKEFIQVPEISLIIRMIWREVGTQNLLNHNDSLMTNKNKYQEYLHNLMSTISNAGYL